MPIRISRLPKAGTTEILCMGAAGIGVLTPLYFMMPGADEHLAKQTTKWAPRWERNISYFAPPVSNVVQRMEPPVAKAIKSVDERLPLEKMAKGMEKTIRGGIDRFGPKPKSS
ncbi:hypothetical protein VHEMI04765 [[Torrubiella] hemipterigena]|uniref:4-coumarate:coenzyme A ligase n=1 Tax=[Torrubiella] hemipterigena TaxID=1531966 RepID=A0A0A1T253_9HYPO|nr:hypothetical protein VHEMI04765 [[Torrubiella] hemipterigena]